MDAGLAVEEGSCFWACFRNIIFVLGFLDSFLDLLGGESSTGPSVTRQVADITNLSIVGVIEVNARVQRFLNGI